MDHVLSLVVKVLDNQGQKYKSNIMYSIFIYSVYTTFMYSAMPWYCTSNELPIGYIF